MKFYNKIKNAFNRLRFSLSVTIFNKFLCQITFTLYKDIVEMVLKSKYKTEFKENNMQHFDFFYVLLLNQTGLL